MVVSKWRRRKCRYVEVRGGLVMGARTWVSVGGRGSVRDDPASGDCANEGKITSGGRLQGSKDNEASTEDPRGGLVGNGSTSALSLGALAARPVSRTMPQISISPSMAARARCFVHRSAGFSLPRTL